METQPIFPGAEKEVGPVERENLKEVCKGGLYNTSNYPPATNDLSTARSMLPTKVE